MINTIKKIDSDIFNIKLGSFDKKNPTTIFITGTAYVMPDNTYDFKELKSVISKKFSDRIRKMLIDEGNFYRNYISVVDLPVERMKNGKKSFLSVEYHIKQKDIKKIPELVDMRTRFIDNIFNGLKNDIEECGMSLSLRK